MTTRFLHGLGVRNDMKGNGVSDRCVFSNHADAGIYLTGSRAFDPARGPHTA